MRILWTTCCLSAPSDRSPPSIKSSARRSICSPWNHAWATLDSIGGCNYPTTPSSDESWSSGVLVNSEAHARIGVWGSKSGRFDCVRFWKAHNFCRRLIRVNFIAASRPLFRGPRVKWTGRGIERGMFINYPAEIIVVAEAGLLSLPSIYFRCSCYRSTTSPIDWMLLDWLLRLAKVSVRSIVHSKTIYFRPRTAQFPIV